MRQEFLTLQPTSFICPVCGYLHRWEKEISEEYVNPKGYKDFRTKWVPAGPLLDCTEPTKLLCKQYGRYEWYCLKLNSGHFFHEIKTDGRSYGKEIRVDEFIDNDRLVHEGNANDITFSVKTRLEVNEEFSKSFFGFVFIGKEAWNINSLTNKEIMLIKLINSIQSIKEVETVTATMRNLQMDGNYEVVDALHKKVEELLKS